MTDYTNSQTRPLAQQSEVDWADRATIANRSMIAEKQFKHLYGPRPVEEHVLVRFLERTTPGWAIAPKRWWYVTQFPKNVTVFATVDANGVVEFDGWLYHKEMRQQAVPGDDPGTHIVEPPLHPMDMFRQGA